MIMDLSLYNNNDIKFCGLCLDTDEEVNIITTRSYGNFLSNVAGLCVPHNGVLSVCVWCLQRIRTCMRLVQDAQKAQQLLMKLYQTNCSLQNVSEVLSKEIQSLKMSKRFVSQTTFHCSTVNKTTEKYPAFNNCKHIKVEHDNSWSAEEVDCHIDSEYETHKNFENMQEEFADCDNKISKMTSKCNISKAPGTNGKIKKHKDPLKLKRKKSKYKQGNLENNEINPVSREIIENSDSKPFVKKEDTESQVSTSNVPLSDEKQMVLKIRESTISKNADSEPPDVNNEYLVRAEKTTPKVNKKLTIKQRNTSGDNKPRSFLTEKGKRKKIGPYFQWSECRDYVELQPMTFAEQAAAREQRRRDAAYVAAPYKCETCALAFPYTDSYIRHMQKHDPSYAPYKCPICEIYSRKTPAKHAACAHGQRYVCFPCGFYARTRQVVIKHFLENHSELILTCLICRTVFKDFTKMKNHGTQAHAIPPHSTQCVHCCKRIKNLRALQQHLKLHEVGSEPSVSQFECDYCKARFSIKSQVYTHIQQLHSGGVYMCKLCDRIFKSDTVLKQHNRRFHTDKDIKRFECDTCGKRFAVLSELRYHILWTHMRQGVKCLHCPKVLKTKYMQQAHIRSVHEHQKAAADKLCDICGKGFTAVSSLQRHAVIHTGERPYACALCPATFTQTSARTTHHRLVHLKLKRQRKSNLQTQLNKSESLDSSS